MSKSAKVVLGRVLIMPNTGGIGTGCISSQGPLAFCWPIFHFFSPGGPTIGGGMKRAFMLGAVALVASCVFAQTSLLSAVAFVKTAFAPLLPDMLAVRDYA